MDTLGCYAMLMQKAQPIGPGFLTHAPAPPSLGAKQGRRLDAAELEVGARAPSTHHDVNDGGRSELNSTALVGTA